MTVVIQRPLRGSRISSFYPVKNLPSLSSLDSAFQLQEYISLLIRLDVHDVDAIVSIPGGAKSSSTGKTEENTSSNETSEGASSSEDKEKSTDSKKNEVTVDEPCWIYEQLRRLAQDLSHPLITMLQQECNRSTCPEMKAGEWLYLCVAHGNDGAMEQCCAIDYILHTIDSATALLNSPRAFPSRLQIPQTSHRHFSSLARRLGRIFAHAYFHHREAFEQAEAESSLYARFLALTSKFDLVPAEFLVIPSRADERDSDADREVQPPKLLAAGLNPSGSNTSQDPHSSQSQSGGPAGLSSTNLNTNRDDWPRNLQIERSKSNSPPHSGGDSPRRVGRSRTDTMVFSDASNIVEELAKAEGEHHSVPPVPKVPDSTSSEAPSLEATTATEETASSEQPAAAATSEEDTPAPAPTDTSDITDELTHEPPSSSSSTTAAVEEEEEHPISSSTPEEKGESSAVDDDVPAATTEPEETEQSSEPPASHEEASDVADAPTSHTEAEESEPDKAEPETTEIPEVVAEDKPVDEAATTSTAPEAPEPITDAEVKVAEETPEDSEAENKDQVAAADEDVEDKPSTDVNVASEDKAEDSHSENTGEGDAKEPTAAANSTSDSDKNSTEH